MISKVNGLNSIQTPNEITKAPDSTANFKEMITKSIESVNKDMTDASKVSESFMAGEKKYDLHEVMISLEKADMSFRYMAQVRNKVLDAYNEIMRMQI